MSQGKARARLRGKRRWFRPRSEPLRIELIRLPVYVVEARFAPSQGGDPVAVRLAVDGLNGGVERLDRSVTLASPTGVARAARGLEQGAMVPPSLSREDALSRANAELPWLSLHFALRRGVVYDLVDIDVSDLVGYPYWVLHTVRRRRRDFRALDGISGKRLGPRGRSLVVQGYILLARQEGTLPSENLVDDKNSRGDA